MASDIMLALCRRAGCFLCVKFQKNLRRNKWIKVWSYVRRIAINWSALEKEILFKIKKIPIIVVRKAVDLPSIIYGAKTSTLIHEKCRRHMGELCYI